jgi:hypothetical protein
MRSRILALLIILLCSSSLFGQVKSKERIPSYFGLQVKPIFPTRFIGSPELSLRSGEEDDLFITSTIRQKLGYSFGGTVRVGLTKLIALETGINFNQRNFDLQMAVPDSSITGQNDLSFISYDIPLNALFYIRLAEKWYMNASLGAAVTFAPTNVKVDTNPVGIHYFQHTGLVESKVGLELNANIGFEFRTEKSGFFYLGGSGRVPIKPIFTLVTEHRYKGFWTLIHGDVDGSYLSVDFKYFFPLIENKGTQFKGGPIVQ